MSSSYDLIITTKNSGKKADGDFSVNGRIEELDDSLEINDEIDGGAADFNVHGGADKFRVHGKITGFTLNGQALVLVDGVSVSLKQLKNGLGYTGPNPPKGYTGPGSPAWGGTGTEDGGPSGNSEEKGESTSMGQRIDTAAGRDGADSVRVFGPDDSSSLVECVRGLDQPMGQSVRLAIEDGDYSAYVLEWTSATVGGQPSFVLVGNPENPYRVRINAPGNGIKLTKDEHTRLEGVTFQKRTQLAGIGHTFVRNCVFSDQNRASHSSLGGKPVAARIQSSDIGHCDEPDRYAAYFYGTGECYFDHGATLRSTSESGYIRNNNTVTIWIDRQAEFPDEKPIVAGRSIYPSDIDGLTKIEATENVF